MLRAAGETGRGEAAVGRFARHG